MKLTAKVKLLTTPEQHDLLRSTMREANEACNAISQAAWNTETFNQFRLHKLTYYDIRETSNLSAQMVVRCIAKVADAYKLDKKTERIFRPDGAIAYDSRILCWKVEERTVSIWTVEGRQPIPFACGERAYELLQTQRGESDLCLIDGTFYLFATCEVEPPEPADVDDFLGVDMGIKNIASDSDGERYSGAHLNNLRKRYHKLRSRLQSKRTKSAKRLLKKRRRKEYRMQNNVNHIISKHLVEQAKVTGRGIALEELTGIRDRVTVRKAQRRQHGAWSFHDLHHKIEYKAALAGVPVVAVDPAYTSQTCPACGHVSRSNRPDQSTFCCVECAFSEHADTVAAVTIRRRAVVNQPHAAGL